MKTSEKILATLFVIFLIGILVVGYQFFILAQCLSFILSFCYMIGGYYFFNYKDHNHALNITAGIILGVTLLLFNLSLWIPVSDFRKAIVVINIIFLLVLVFWWIYKKAHFSLKMKHLALRSFVIAVITSFLSFSPVETEAYRYVLLQMSKPESKIYENISMFNEIKKSEESSQRGDYKNAIKYAQNSIKHGKNWLDYDVSRYKSISGVYEKLARVYIEYGNHYYDKQLYDNAITNYLKADSVFNHKEHVPAFAKATKSDIYWNRYNLLLAFDKVADYDSYDTELNFLISDYASVKDTLDFDYYSLAKSAAKNYAKRGLYKDALAINKASLTILKPDSLNQLQEFENIYKRIVSNYLSLQQYSDCEAYLDKYESLASGQDCFYLYAKAILSDRTNINEGLAFAKKSYDCYNLESNYNNQFSSGLLLANFEFKQSNFENFETQVSNAKKLTSSTNNPEYNNHLIELTLGHYHQVIGNYREALTHFDKALDYPESDPVFISLRKAVIKKDLDITYDKNVLTAQTLAYLSDFDNSPELASVQSMLADINGDRNTKLSDSLYQVVIDTQYSYDLQYSGDLGVAYNGLGVNRLIRKEFKEADLMFEISMDIMSKYYGSNRNVNQLVTALNIVESKWLQKKYKQSFKALEKAKLIKNKCFSNTNTIYDAYLLKLEADLMFGNSELQKEKYEQSLNIARNYLGDHHWLINYLQGKLAL